MTEHCVIFGAMPVSNALASCWENADLLIAADAGYQTMRALGLTPHVLLGDYDSAPPPQHPTGEMKVLPREKDDTDTYYAARYALSHGARRVTILGGLGGRLDHTLANLHTLVYLAKNGVEARMADEYTEICVLTPGEYHFPHRKGYVSLFPVGEEAAGVTLTGLHYPLKDATLTCTWPVGVSNVFEPEAKQAVVSLKKGMLYLVFAKEK